MTKQDVLIAFNEVIESTRLWDEMADHLFALGAELYETKYAESLYFHQGLVWRMIKEFRGYEELEEYEFSVYSDTLYDLGKNEPFKYTDADGQAQVLTDREQILDLFLSPDFVMREVITLNPQFLENF